MVSAYAAAVASATARQLKSSCDTAAPGAPHPLAALGVVEQGGEGQLELPDVTGLDQHGAVAVARRRPRGSPRPGTPPRGLQAISSAVGSEKPS